MSTVISMDPGLASYGWAVIELGAVNTADRVVAVGVIRTKKTAARHGLLVAHDDVRRCEHIIDELLELVKKHKPAVLCAELPSGAQSARAAAALGMAKAIVAAIKTITGLPLLACSPAELKQAVCGAKTASKVDVQEGLMKLYSGITWPRRKGDIEHAADALGAFVACQASPVISMARQLAKGAA